MFWNMIEELMREWSTPRHGIGNLKESPVYPAGQILRDDIIVRQDLFSIISIIKFKPELKLHNRKHCTVPDLPTYLKEWGGAMSEERVILKIEEEQAVLDHFSPERKYNQIAKMEKKQMIKLTKDKRRKNKKKR